MAVIVGIDEAGLGPILGPLVISSTAFRLPDQYLKKDLWQVLKKSTANKRKHLAGRLLIADSKKAYTKSLGLKHLDRTTLAALSCLDIKPQNLSEFLTRISDGSVKRLSRYKWYAEIKDSRLNPSSKDIQLASAVFAKDLEKNNMSLASVNSSCIDVACYNELIDKIQNKSSAVFGITCRHIKQAFDKFGRENLQILIDRQGGRTRYAKHLLKMFPKADLKVLKETQSLSSYRITQEDKKMKLHFMIKADDRHLPVALSSMISKYIRELMMAELNSYFLSFNNNIEPTAGYWKDGKRFLADIEEHLPEMKYEKNFLIRSR